MVSHEKYFSFVLCVVHNTFLALIMRYSRTQSSGPIYFSSTAVIMVEIIKVILCLVVVFHESNYSWRSFAREISLNPLDSIKMVVPAGIYAIHNNILYYGLSHLEVPVYQVTNQLKIFSTAIFFTILLKHKLPLQKWMSLLIMFVGISVVQLQVSSQSSSSQKQNPLLGLLAVSTAAITSGFAGVYFEKILKGSQTLLWVLNLYLCSFGLLFSIFVAIIHDGAALIEYGFFYGWNPIVIVVVVNQAVGGLIISFVVKYANTIIKGFISSLSIILSTVISVYFFDFQVNWWFGIGSFFVFSGMYLYQLPDTVPTKIVKENSGISNKPGTTEKSTLPLKTTGKPKTPIKNIGKSTTSTATSPNKYREIIEKTKNFRKSGSTENLIRQRSSKTVLLNSQQTSSKRCGNT